MKIITTIAASLVAIMIFGVVGATASESNPAGVQIVLGNVTLLEVSGEQQRQPRRGRAIVRTRACFGVQRGNPPSRWDVNVKGQFGKYCIVGRRGVRGPRGPRGLPGKDGTDGQNGSAGATGAQGPAGPAGPAGATGAIGPAGPQGLTGATGAQGPKGEKGEAGGLGDGTRWLCFNGNPGGGVNDGGIGAQPDCAPGAKVAYKVVTLGTATQLK